VPQVNHFYLLQCPEYLLSLSKDTNDQTCHVFLFQIDEIDHFLTCVETRSQPLSNGWEALKMQLFVEDIIHAGV
jgi:hypothetical protein